MLQMRLTVGRGRWARVAARRPVCRRPWYRQHTHRSEQALLPGLTQQRLRLVLRPQELVGAGSLQTC